MTVVADLPQALAAATEHQPGARAALAAALRAPVHAYLFAGPKGSGKAAAARGFAAELLADGSADPDDARRRALADPSPHPDLTWLRPSGTQYLVEEIRARVISAAAYRPFEGERRVFVIEAAEAMAEESQNALLKTLEEPAAYAHLLLLSSEPAQLLETVRSRCQPIRFAAPAPDVIEAELKRRGLGASAEARHAAARLSGGDTAVAAALLEPPGSELRDAASGLVAAALTGDFGDSPWLALAVLAEQAGEERAAAARADLEEAAALEGSAAARRAGRDAADAARRAGRLARTQALDLGLGLVCAWLRDLAAVAAGAEELVLNSDRIDDLREHAQMVDARRPRRAAEIVMDTRRRLQVNVGEELALEAVAFRLEAVLRSA